MIARFRIPAFFSAAAVFFCIITSCNSLFQDSTSLGSGVLSSVDPSITGFDGNFKTVAAGLPVVDSYSRLFRKTGSLLPPGFHAGTGELYAGKWQGETAVITMRFAGDSLARIVNDTAGLRLMGASLHVKCSHTFSTNSVPDISLATGWTGDNSATSDTSLSVLTTTDPTDSTRLLISIILDELDLIRDEIAKKGFVGAVQVRIDTIGSGAETVFDTIYDSTYGTFRLYMSADTIFEVRPESLMLKISYLRGNNLSDTLSLSLFADSLSRLVTDTVHDDLPAASSMAGRAAVMKLDLTGFWQEATDSETGMQYRNIMSSTIGLNAVSASFRSSDTVNLYFDMFASDTGVIDTSRMSKARMVFNSGESATPLIIDTLNLKNINRMFTENPPGAGYLHIVLGRQSGFSAALFAKPDTLHMKTIFSNLW